MQSSQASVYTEQGIPVKAFLLQECVVSLGAFGATSPARRNRASSISQFMHPPSVPQLLKYNITPMADGVLLRIWEPAERNEIRVKPFLFMVKYRLPSEAEARRFVSSYLSLYRSTQIQTIGGSEEPETDD